MKELFKKNRFELIPTMGDRTEEKKKFSNSEESYAQLEIFHYVGNYGPWQRTVAICFFLVFIIGVWQNFAITFMAPNMDFWCVETESHGLNATHTTISRTNSTDQCEVFSPEANKTVACTGWEYDTSEYYETIITEWNLVCKRGWMVSFAKSVYMFGFLVSVFVFGQISDCIGRFPTIMICYVITCVATISSAWSSSYLMFVILRFFSAFGRTGLTTTGYVLLMEIFGPKWRTEMGILIQFGWSFGFLIMPIVTYFVRPWYWLQLAIATPILPLICIYWLVPESPRWLMTQGKKDSFIRTMMQAAKKNGRDVKPEELDTFMEMKLKEGNEETFEKRTVLDLFKRPRMAKRTICIATLWMVNAFVYYALSYNTNDLGGNIYLNFFYSGTMECLSYIATIFIIKKYGRKYPLIVGMMIAGVACASIMAVPRDMHWLIVTLSMVGKFCITGTFGLLYLYTTEMFPTAVRNIAIGFCSTCARVGSITAPFARELELATHYTAPFALNAGLSILTSLLTFWLPETKGMKIVDTMQEGEDFGLEKEVEEVSIEKRKTTNNE